jgi:hypothetical protein
MQRSDSLNGSQEVHLTQTNPRPGFWRRQFADTVTNAQLIFDVALGIVLPILCFVFDPIVFNNSIRGASFGPDLFQFKALVYLLSTLSILTLSLWLILGRRTGSVSGIIAGVLLAGSLCSLIIGILILPLSIVGMLLLIGVLGFTPFFTSFVYLRNSVRSFNVAKTDLRQTKLRAFLLLGTLLVIGPSVLANWQINHIITESMNELLRGDARSADSATQTLRYVAWAADIDQLVWAYFKETDQTRKGNLARAYKEITGIDIETRLARSMD